MSFTFIVKSVDSMNGLNKWIYPLNMFEDDGWTPPGAHMHTFQIIKMVSSLCIGLTLLGMSGKTMTAVGILTLFSLVFGLTALAAGFIFAK